MNYLKKLRVKNKLSQDEMSRILDVAQSTVCKIEKDTFTPNAEILKVLRKRFKLNINKMLDEDII